MSNFVIKSVLKMDTSDDNIPEDYVFEVSLIIRDHNGIDQNTEARKELAEAIRLLCEVVNAN
tara:strand:- start:238 stop:423 length:186 start_codon:yes stop_codon:yes gene_type:complete